MQICNQYVSQIQSYYDSHTDKKGRVVNKPVAGTVITFMDAHLQFDGLIQAMGIQANPASVIRGYARGKWSYTVPEGKLIVGMRGQTIRSLSRKLMGVQGNWDMLYTITGIYTVDAKDICDPQPQFHHIGGPTWSTPSSWKNWLQTFDVSFTDIYAGFFLCGFWMEVNSIFTGIIKPGQCMYPCTSYAGMIIRHYATGEERLYTIAGTSKCGQKDFYKPQMIKTYSHWSALSYISVDVMMGFETPLCEITKVGQRNMWKYFPPKDPRVKTPSTAPLMKGSCSASDNFGKFQPIPSCRAPPAVIDGKWSAYGVWSDCKNGKKTRSRTCTPPQNGGKACVGSAVEEVACSIGINAPTPETKKPTTNPNVTQPATPTTVTPNKLPEGPLDKIKQYKDDFMKLKETDPKTFYGVIFLIIIIILALTVDFGSEPAYYESYPVQSYSDH